MNIRQDAAMNERVMTIEEMQRNTAQSGYYRSKQAGISLVEVLVVIVILAIGIFSVVRLFPPGCLSNRQTEDLTRASRLGDQEAARYRTSSSNLPDAIIPVRYDSGTGQFVVDNTTTPDDLSDLPVETGNQFPWSHYYSDVNKFRRVIGETVRIPLASPTSAGRGSIYLLGSGPFMDVQWPNQTRGIFVQGAPLIRTSDPNAVIGNSPSSFLNGPSNYAVDYSSKKIAFFPSAYARQFLITFSYYDNSAAGRVNTVVDQVITVPANQDDPNLAWIPIAVPGNSEMVQYSDSVGRRFTEIPVPVSPNPPAWSNDPYEFFVYSPTVGSLGNVGVLAFNPIGRDYTEYSASGNQPLTARIDYDVLDWHIIREERSMPASSPYIVSLSLRDLKKLGDIEDDQTSYDGLFYGVPAANNVGDLMVYDTTNGALIPPRDINTGQLNYTVQYRDGTITFSDVFGSANSNANFRFFYKAVGDWALTAQKAAASYRRRLDASVGYGEYYLGTGAAGAGLSTRMYYPLSEAGKTIAIRQIWYKNGANNSVNVSNESYRVNDDRSKFEVIAGIPLTWIDLNEKHTDAVSWDDTSSGAASSGVQGVSFRTRVLWRNGSTSSVDGGGNNAFHTRWRKVDTDTILTRGTSSP